MSVLSDLSQHLKNIGNELAGDEAALNHAQAQWQTHHDRAHAAHQKMLEAMAKADQFRKEHEYGKAAKEDRHAREARLHAKKEHEAAVADIQEVKRLNQKVKGLEATQKTLEDKLKAAQRKANKVTIDGNKVRGGKVDHRIQVCMLASAHACSTGRRHNFYSQEGAWDVDHCITGPAYGHRDDCSSWATSVYKSCGLPDPMKDAYHGGYTGTWSGKHVTREEARKTAGCGVLFGSYPFHHIELALGDGTEHTIGHGSAPVDLGSFDLLPGPVTFIKPARS